MRKLLLFLLLSILFYPTHAQQDTIDIFKLSLFDLTRIKVSTPARSYQNVQQAPSSIIILTQKEIFENNYSCLRDLLKDIPQIIIQRRASAEDEDIYSVNGIPGIEKMLILMDGVRINSASGTDYPIGDAYSLENVKQVEIILNPSSTLYGADAYTAIINIITFTPKEHPGVYLKAARGNFNTKTLNFLINKQINKIGVSISGKYYYSDEPFMPIYYPDEYKWYYHYLETGEVVYFGDTIKPDLPIMPWDIHTKAASLKARITYKNFQIGFSDFYNTHSTSYTSPPEIAIYSRQAHYHTNIANFFLIHNYSNQDKTFNTRTILWGQNFRILPNSAFINRYTGFNIGYKYENNNNIHWEQNFIFNPQKAYHFHIGFALDYFDVIPKTGDLIRPYDPTKPYNQQFIPYPGTDVVDTNGNSLIIYQDIYRIKYYNTAAYLQFEKEFIKKFHLTLGLRSEYNSQYGATLVPRASLVYNPSSKISVKLMYGKSFRAPSPHIAYAHFGSFVPVYDSTGNVIRLSAPFWRLTNPNLKPELKDNYTFLINLNSEKNHTFLSAKLFYNSLYNLITRKTVFDTTFHGIPVDYAWIPDNNASGYTYGYNIIFGKQFKIAPFAFSLITSYTYINGKINNNSLEFYTPHSVKINFTISLPEKFNIALSGQYRDKTFRNSDIYAPPYFIASGTGNFLLYSGRKFSVWEYFKINNLLNRKYYNVTNGELNPLPQQPVRILFGFKIQIK